ncbi:ATP-binding cassette domain-containing protein [Rhizobium sp. TRM95111]|uniref:ABC transporter ATP-binding protein n=1 Tax=Rhizobium alarense TaxID=2846851 RepID=UPI001F38993F|nr:oligopeptide/dipeptide ABC transporter ATP-binding protein [Rhizobium alarense]MCF3642010.1 ATP-binding cassette domain-containing protein [Rhizobium alarense]
MTDTNPLLELRHLRKHYPIKPNFWGRPTAVVHAMDDVCLSVRRGETLSIVGESGCGKSTLGKTVVRLHQPSSGAILLNGQRVDNITGAALRAFRSRVQIVFQDPFSSLNPRHTVRDTLAEPMANFGIAKTASDIDARVGHLLDMVGLPRDAGARYPHQFSGGQRQRIAIARALAPNPELIVCDEAVSALDVSVKAQIVNLLQDIQQRTGLTLLFISHDLAIVEHLTHRVAVMYLGRVVEEGDRRSIFGASRHPYTRALLSAVPVAAADGKRQRILLKGDVPSPIRPPSGCRFHTRCPFAVDRCRAEVPQLRDIDRVHRVACHFDNLPLG